MNSIFNIVFSCFTHEQVKEINKKIKMNFETKQNLKEGAQNVDKIGDFYHVLCSPLMELLHPWLYQCQFINTQYFGYDIYWNFHLEKFNYKLRWLTALIDYVEKIIDKKLENTEKNI